MIKREDFVVMKNEKWYPTKALSLIGMFISILMIAIFHTEKAAELGVWSISLFSLLFGWGIIKEAMVIYKKREKEGGNYEVKN